ncbi:MAG: HYR domain-containing protein, partial [bacterium]
DLLACAPDADTIDVTVEDTTDPELTCPDDIVVECSASGGTPADDPDIAAFLAGATAMDICDDSLTINNDGPAFFNLGSTVVNFDTSDDSANSDMCSATVDVADTTAPTITSVVASPNSLWPPNHKMVPVSVDVSVTDICDPNPVCQVTSVVSNEPLNGKGDGNTNIDWEIIGDLSVNLRSERAGGGNGRIYTIGVECSDGSGNSTDGSVNVSVPHNR